MFKRFGCFSSWFKSHYYNKSKNDYHDSLDLSKVTNCKKFGHHSLQKN